MRLIDADALKKYLDNESYTYPEDEEFGCGFNECLLQVFMAIDNAPTIVVRTKIKFEERNNDNGKLQRRKG